MLSTLFVSFSRMFEPWYLFFPILCGNIALGISFSILNFVLIPLVSHSTGNVVSSGTAFFFGMVMACFLNPFLGRLTDILGRCALVVSILFSSAVVSAYTISYVTGLPLQCLAAFFVCATFSLSGLYSAFVAKHSKQMARVRSFGLTIGTTTIAAFSSSLFIKHLFDVDPARTVRLLAIAILLFSVPLFVYVPFEKEAFKKDRSKRTPWPILTNTRLLVFFLAQAGAWFALGGVLPFLTSFLHKTVGLTIGQASEWAGLCSLISGASSILCGLLKQDSKERDLVRTCILYFVKRLVYLYRLERLLGKGRAFSFANSNKYNKRFFLRLEFGRSFLFGNQGGARLGLRFEHYLYDALSGRSCGNLCMDGYLCRL